MASATNSPVAAGGRRSGGSTPRSSQLGARDSPASSTAASRSASVSEEPGFRLDDHPRSPPQMATAAAVAAHAGKPPRPTIGSARQSSSGSLESNSATAVATAAAAAVAAAAVAGHQDPGRTMREQATRPACFDYQLLQYFELVHPCNAHSLATLPIPGLPNTAVFAASRGSLQCIAAELAAPSPVASGADADRCPEWTVRDLTPNTDFADHELIAVHTTLARPDRRPVVVVAFAKPPRPGQQLRCFLGFHGGSAAAGSLGALMADAQTLPLAYAPLAITSAIVRDDADVPRTVVLVSGGIAGVRGYVLDMADGKMIEVDLSLVLPELCNLPSPPLHIDVVYYCGQRIVAVGCQNGFVRVTVNATGNLLVPESAFSALAPLSPASSSGPAAESGSGSSPSLAAQSPSMGTQTPPDILEIPPPLSSADVYAAFARDPQVRMLSRFLDGPVTSLALFTPANRRGIEHLPPRMNCDLPPPPFTRPGTEWAMDLRQTIPLAPSEDPAALGPLHLVVGGSVGHANVYEDILGSGLERVATLPSCWNGDSVLCVAAFDLDYDGENEIALGTFGGDLIVFKDEGSCYQPVLQTRLANPVYSILWEDITGDGSAEIVVSTMYGVHILQADLGWAASRVLIGIQLLKEIRALESTLDKERKKRGELIAALGEKVEAGGATVPTAE